MWPELLREQVRRDLRGTLWWAFGLALYAAVTWAFYPTIRSSPDIAGFVDRLPAALRAAFGVEDFISPGGYAWARMFSLLLPLTLIIYAVRAGTRAVAGDEQDGRLELLLAQPVTRTELLLGRTLALGANLALLGLTVFLSTAIGARLVDADLPLGRLALATLAVTGLAWTLGALALAVGSATGRPGLASGVAAGVTLASYLDHSLSPQVEALRALRGVSPFWYAIGESPFRGTPHPTGALVLLAAGAVLVLLGAPRFVRRDLR
ncbi:ABC transporter permease subunit [Deinococcus pimensis]|uniref:ABC transporter permease subunit n=1 Tax=Deinococcus pimensis TaxID=309888 RepID=UPI00048771B6|nr:ABC transporter permease subunit [Deinococcus pimensis]